MKTVMAAICVIVLCAGAAVAQNPLSTDTKMAWNTVKNYIARAAEKMPEENYAFKPVPEVRSYGQLIGHIADAQFMLCAAASGEKRAPAGIEKTKTTKSDLIAALKESNEYCDGVYNGMTDAKAVEMVKGRGGERPRLGILNMNTSHSNEHYGNIVTYLRIKGLVPPSSEPRK